MFFFLNDCSFPVTQVSLRISLHVELIHQSTLFFRKALIATVYQSFAYNFLYLFITILVHFWLDAEKYLDV